MFKVVKEMTEAPRIFPLVPRRDHTRQVFRAWGFMPGYCVMGRTRQDEEFLGSHRLGIIPKSKKGPIEIKKSGTIAGQNHR